MKKLIALLFLTTSAFGATSCPQATFPENQKIGGEFSNVCYNISYPHIVNGTASSMTITGITVTSGTLSNVRISTFTASSATITNSSISNLTLPTIGATQTVVTDANSLLTGTLTGTGMYALGQSNILINGGYEIWQRGTTFSLGSGGSTYQSDRWSYPGLPAGAVTLSQESTTVHDGTYSMKLNVTNAGSGQSLYIIQQVENYKDFAGKTVSLSAWVNTTLSNVAIAMQNGTVTSSVHPGDGAWHLLTVTTTLASNITFLNIFVPYTTTNVAVGIIYVDSAMLVVGPQPVNYVPRPFGQELTLCQRYFQKSYDINTASGAVTLAGAIYGGTPAAAPTLNEIDITLLFKTTMRIAPTMVIYDMAGTSSKCNRIAFGASSTAGQSISVNTVGTNSVILFSGSGVSASGIGVHYLADAEM